MTDYRQSLVLCRELDNQWLLVETLIGIADAMVARGEAEAAVRILAAADALRARINFSLYGTFRDLFERSVTMTHGRLGLQALHSGMGAGPTGVIGGGHPRRDDPFPAREQGSDQIPHLPA